MTFKKFYNGLLAMSGKPKNPISFVFVLLVWVFYAQWVYMSRERKARKNDNKG